MKLFQKLSLSFSVITLLLVIISVLSWNAVRTLNNQQQLILQTEDAITGLSNVKTFSLSAVAEVNPEHLNKTMEELNKAKTFVANIKKIAEREGYTTTLNKSIAIENEINTLMPIYSNMKANFSNIREIDEKLTVIGGNITILLDKASQKALIDYNNYTNPEFFVTASKLKELVGLLRVSTANYLLSKSQNSLNAAQNAITAITSYIDTIPATTRSNFAETIEQINAYHSEIPGVLKSTSTLQELLIKSNTIIDSLIHEGQFLSNNARAEFITAEKNVNNQIIIGSVFAVIIAIFLSIFISKNVTTQLGADPSELEKVAMMLLMVAL